MNDPGKEQMVYMHAIKQYKNKGLYINVCTIMKKNIYIYIR